MRYAGSHTTTDKSFSPLTTYEGEIDFENNRSTYVGREHGADREGDVTTSRRIDEYLYYTDSSSTDGDSDPSKPWTRVFDTTNVSGLGVGDVSGLFRDLERVGDGKRLAPETVRGVSTEHYRFEIPARTVPEQLIAMRFATGGDRTVEIWADAQHRLRRIVEATPGTSDRHETEYFDFGAPVTIEAPPADQVSIEDEPVLTGDWKLVQHGRDGDVEWQIYQAPTKDGACLAYEAHPSGPAHGFYPEMRGRAPDFSASDPSDAPEGVPLPPPGDGFNATATLLTNGTALVYGRVPAGTRSVALHYRDGHTEQLTPKGGTFAFAVSGDAVVDEIPPDVSGSKLHCTLGEVPSFNCADTSGGTIAPPPDLPPDLPPGVPSTTVPTTPGS